MTHAPPTKVPMPTPLITKGGTGEQTELTRAFEKALALGFERKSKLRKEIIGMVGMSGQMYRHFINNLIEFIPDARYLEVGSWAGSTMCSAINGNSLRAFAIDNWSEFAVDDIAKYFLSNVSGSTNKEVSFNMLTSDFRKVDYSQLGGKFNVYLFDGPHEEQDQYDGVRIAMPAMDNEFILIVDDYNFHRVQLGTQRAIHDERLEILSAYQILTTPDGTHHDPAVSMQNSEWHNGYFMAVLRKS